MVLSELPKLQAEAHKRQWDLHVHFPWASAFDDFSVSVRVISDESQVETRWIRVFDIPVMEVWRRLESAGDNILYGFL